MIKIFEAFSGIGSQLRALQKIYGKNNVISVGQIEWFLDAIIGWLSIHEGKYFNHKNLESKKCDISDIKKMISLDSKNPIINSKKITKNQSEYILKSYNKNNTFDIKKTTWKNIPKNIDIFTYSFPCQDLSTQGKQMGLKAGSKTRSSLLWEIKRIIKEMNQNLNINDLPKYLLMENVPQVIAKQNLPSFNKFLKDLKNVGYISKYYLLTASDFGSCQKRKRCFCLSIREDFAQQINWEWPDFIKQNISKTKTKIKDILEEELKLPKNCWLPNLNKYERTEFKETSSGMKKALIKGYSEKFRSEAFVFDVNNIGPTLTASGAQSRIKIISNEGNIRKLSAIECLKYMGFNKKDYDKMKATNLLTDNDIIFLAGNSISINVLEEIFRSVRF